MMQYSGRWKRASPTASRTPTFGPHLTCTRAQAVTFLWRLAGSPAPQSQDMPFADVTEDAYYRTAVQWAVEQGITNGVTATVFAPDQTVSRSQMVTFLHRFLPVPRSHHFLGLCRCEAQRLLLQCSAVGAGKGHHQRYLGHRIQPRPGMQSRTNGDLPVPLHPLNPQTLSPVLIHKAPGQWPGALSFFLHRSSTCQIFGTVLK